MGTVTAAAHAVPSASPIEYRPVIEPTRSGNQRLTTTGISTLLTAMPASARALAARKVTVPPAKGRRASPAVIATMPVSTTGAEPPRRASTRRQAPEQREAQRRYGGQQPGDDTVHAEVGPYLLQQRAEGGDGGTEVEGREEQADDEEAEDPARRVRGGCRRGRRGTVGALQAVFRHLHGVHHRIMG